MCFKYLFGFFLMTVSVVAMGSPADPTLHDRLWNVVHSLRAEANRLVQVANEGDVTRMQANLDRHAKSIPYDPVKQPWRDGRYNWYSSKNIPSLEMIATRLLTFDKNGWEQSRCYVELESLPGKRFFGVGRTEPDGIHNTYLNCRRYFDDRGEDPLVCDETQSIHCSDPRVFDFRGYRQSEEDKVRLDNFEAEEAQRRAEIAKQKKKREEERKRDEAEKRYWDHLHKTDPKRYEKEQSEAIDRFLNPHKYGYKKAPRKYKWK